MNGVTIIVLFLILLATGLPVAYVMYATAGIYFLSIGLNMSVMIQKMGSSMNSITMVAIPMFIFAGTLMNNVNLTDSLFHSIEITPIGKMRGGLAQVNVIASLVFAGMSGSQIWAECQYCVSFVTKVILHVITVKNGAINSRDFSRIDTIAPRIKA